MAPPKIDPICMTKDGRNLVHCQAHGLYNVFHHLGPNYNKTSSANKTSSEDTGTHIGAETYTGVAIDNSKQGTMTAEVNIEQTMGSIIVILGILLALYLCRYGFHSIRQTTITHFGNTQQPPHPSLERTNRNIYRPQPPPRNDSTTT